MGDRSETTKSLSSMVEARLRGKAYWSAEVMLGAADARSKRVDYMAFNLDRRDWGEITAASMERGTFSCYEVKSCMADFESGHGLNFIGDENYLVCERELADRLHAEVRIPNGCTVLCPNRPRTALIQAYANRPGGKPRRNGSAAEFLFCMVVPGIHRPSE